MERLIEITGDVRPPDRFAHLAGRTYLVDGVRLSIERDGRFRCTALEGQELPEEAEHIASTVLEAMAFESDVVATVTISGFSYEGPSGSRSRRIIGVTASAQATGSLLAVVRRGDGSVSPNPEEAAWLARVLRSDFAVAAAYELLREAMTAPNRRTVVDYIAFEAMKQAEGSRVGLRTKVGWSEARISALSGDLQNERHLRPVGMPPDFNPAATHREVVQLFMDWALSRGI